MPVRIPYDVIGEIINQLSDNKASLHACSLVCKATLPLCRLQIFYEIKLRGFRGFSDLLAGSPLIADCVRVLSLTIQDTDDITLHCQSLFKLNRLHTLKLVYRATDDYRNKFLQVFKPVLHHLLSLPTILTLEFTESYPFTEFKLPYVYLTYSRNLRTLLLNSIDLEFPGGMETSFVGSPLKSLDLWHFPLGKFHILQQYMAKRLLNLSHLETLKIGGFLEGERDVFQSIIQVCAPTIQNLSSLSSAFCPLQLEAMPEMPSLRIFNVALYWENAETQFGRRQNVTNHHLTDQEIASLSKILSSCPNLKEINISINLGETYFGHDTRDFANGQASLADWRNCLKMCKVMDKALSQLELEKLGYISFTLNIGPLELGGKGVIVRRYFPHLSATGILRVTVVFENYGVSIPYIVPKEG